MSGEIFHAILSTESRLVVAEIREMKEKSDLAEVECIRLISANLQ